MGGQEQPAGMLPDTIPLPELPADLLHKVAVASAEAQVVLYEELQTCWSNCPLDKPRRGVDPKDFFPPFVKYGVALYEARSAALLELRPPLWKYQAWLNFALKTLICDELAPYRSTEDLAAPLHSRRLSAWQAHMGQTWRLSEHGDSPELFSEAKRLMDLLENPIEGHWSRFNSVLHNAISRRTLPLLTEALKRLGPEVAAPQAVTQMDPTDAKPMPPIAQEVCAWGEVQIRFLSDHRVEITTPKCVRTLNYAEFGFADRRAKNGGPKPNQAWETLLALADGGGLIRVDASPSSTGLDKRRDPELENTARGKAHGRGRAKLEKRIQDIRNVLRRYFALAGNPIPFIKGSGYRSAFKVGLAPSYNT